MSLRLLFQQSDQVYRHHFLLWELVAERVDPGGEWVRLKPPGTIVTFDGLFASGMTAFGGGTTNMAFVFELDSGDESAWAVHAAGFFFYPEYCRSPVL